MLQRILPPLNFKNLNEVMKISNKDASSEATRLQVLYRSATDVNNAQQNRIKSVKELQREFPAYFKGIKDEDILNEGDLFAIFFNIIFSPFVSKFKRFMKICASSVFVFKFNF